MAIRMARSDQKLEHFLMRGNRGSQACSAWNRQLQWNVAAALGSYSKILKDPKPGSLLKCFTEEHKTVVTLKKERFCLGCGGEKKVQGEDKEQHIPGVQTVCAVSVLVGIQTSLRWKKALSSLAWPHSWPSVWAQGWAGHLLISLPIRMRQIYQILQNH